MACFQAVILWAIARTNKNIFMKDVSIQDLKLSDKEFVLVRLVPSIALYFRIKKGKVN